jgi:hypothetical protein
MGAIVTGLFICNKNINLTNIDVIAILDKNSEHFSLKIKIDMEFLKTDTVISEADHEDGVTLQGLLDVFRKTANDRGIKNVVIDGDIAIVFAKTKLWIKDYDNESDSRKLANHPDVFKFLSSRLYRFEKDITYRSMIETTKRSGAYQQYAIGEALICATKLVAEGELDNDNERGIMIYLLNTTGTPLRLKICRFPGGRLLLHLGSIDAYRIWLAGCGILTTDIG